MMYRLGMAHTENYPCQTGPQFPEHVLHFCPLFREVRQHHSPQSTFYSSAPSSENQDRTTVPRARSTVLLPLQRIKTGPQSPEHVLQYCSLFRESRQDHSPQNTFYSSVPSSEKPEGSSGPHGATLQEQLWDNNMEDLLKTTTTFFQTTRLTV